GVNWGVSSLYTDDADLYLPSDKAASQRLNEDYRHPDTRIAPGAIKSGMLEGKAIQAAILQTIDKAKGNILIIANYFTNYTLQNAVTASVKKGNTCELLLNPLGYGANSAAKWMSEHGCTVRMAPDSPYLHAKVILTPQGGVIGSANFSYDGLNHNREADVVIPRSLLADAQSWATQLWNAGTPYAS
ncbi:MAG: phospholipase D family protein, partial [Candidatus Saccharimonadales bacterium]